MNFYDTTCTLRGNNSFYWKHLIENIILQQVAYIGNNYIQTR